MSTQCSNPRSTAVSAYFLTPTVSTVDHYYAVVRCGRYNLISPTDTDCLANISD